MREHELKKILNDASLVDDKIKEFLGEKVLAKGDVVSSEIKGHIEKAEHNLRFITEAIRSGFLDWAITGCYYACYHAVLSLIMTKGYSSKNHLATLYVLIKEFYKKELNEEDIKIFYGFLDYTDVLFYVESKNKRENATYSTKMLFDKKEAEKLRIKAALFVSKIRQIIT